MKLEIRNLLLVGMGGFLGSVFRYFFSGAVHQFMQSGSFPYGTVFVNITGCFFIGFGNGLADFRQMLTPELRLFLMMGLLGGFTTFSAFGYETMALVRDGEFFSASTYVVSQVLFGLWAVWLGYSVTRYL